MEFQPNPIAMLGFAITGISLAIGSAIGFSQIATSGQWSLAATISFIVSALGFAVCALTVRKGAVIKPQDGRKRP